MVPSQIIGAHPATLGRLESSELVPDPTAINEVAGAADRGLTPETFF